MLSGKLQQYPHSVPNEYLEGKMDVLALSDTTVPYVLYMYLYVIIIFAHLYIGWVISHVYVSLLLVLVLS